MCIYAYVQLHTYALLCTNITIHHISINIQLQVYSIYIHRTWHCMPPYQDVRHRLKTRHLRQLFRIISPAGGIGACGCWRNVCWTNVSWPSRGSEHPMTFRIHSPSVSMAKLSKTKQASAEKDCRTCRSRNILWSPIYTLKLSSLEELQQDERYPSSECCGACISTEGAVHNLRMCCHLLGTSWDFLFAILFVSIYLFVSAWAFLTVLSLGHGALKT